MNIGINASGISRMKGGASFYIINIIKALAAEDGENKYFVFCSKAGMREFADLPENFKIAAIAPGKVFARLLWEQTILPFFHCRKHRINVLFSPNYTSPLLHPGFKSIVTIHDLSFFPLGRLYPPQRRLFRLIIKLSVKVANEIIAVSEHTKKDILKYVGDYSKKITVVYEAADERYSEPVLIEAVDRIRKKYNIKNDYILFTGFLEPRKNLQRLLEAFAQIKKEIPHHLVITGGKGWWYNSTFENVKRLGLTDYVVFTGYIGIEDLPALYAGATLFAFPSLYEGFGISVLESINCGTPVLVSNNTALPEVAGEAGVYVDPYDVGDIGKKMLEVLSNSEYRKLLREKCREIGKKFSWKSAARQTKQVLLEP